MEENARAVINASSLGRPITPEEVGASEAELREDHLSHIENLGALSRERASSRGALTDAPLPDGNGHIALN